MSSQRKTSSGSPSSMGISALPEIRWLPRRTGKPKVQPCGPKGGWRPAHEDKGDIEVDVPSSLSAAVVTVLEAAKLCRVSPKTVRRMLLRGQLKAGPRIGRRLSVTRDSVDEVTEVDTRAELRLED